MQQNSSSASNKTVIFNGDNREYYRKKRERIAYQNEIDAVVRDDAAFIKYYGMSAFLELFPDAKNLSMDWHRAVLRELKRLERIDLSNNINGVRLAFGANFNKKICKEYNNLIKLLK